MGGSNSKLDAEDNQVAAEDREEGVIGQQVAQLERVNTEAILEQVHTKRGPVADANRKCRDVLFVLLFICFWVGMITIAGVAFEKGRPARLVYPMDNNGNLCGFDNVGDGDVDIQMDNRDRPHLLFPNPFDILSQNASMCVPECLDYGMFSQVCSETYAVHGVPTNERICRRVFELPPTSVLVSYVTETMVEWVNCTGDCSTKQDIFNDACDEECKDTLVGYITELSDLIADNTADHSEEIMDLLEKVFEQQNTFSYGTEEVFHFCLPLTALKDALAVIAENAKDAADAIPQFRVDEAVSGASETFSRLIGDVKTSWDVILGSGMMAVVFGFIWLHLVRWMAAFIAYMTVILTNLLLFGMAAQVIEKGHRLEQDGIDLGVESDEKNGRALMGFGYIMLAFAIVVLLVTFVMLKRIKLAIGVIREAARALEDMPLMVIVPWLTFFFMACFSVYWCFVAVWLASSGKVVAHGPIKELQLDEDLRRSMAYHFFGLLWSIALLSALNHTTIAGAVAQWYFTMPDQKTDKKDLPNSVVGLSLWRTIRYSLGSLIFGSFIIAVVRMIRYALYYHAKQIKPYAEKYAWGKCILCCVDYCIRCFERFVQFITKQAYIQIAIYGFGFCKAAKEGFMLVMSNVLRIAAINTVGDFILFLGKLGITLCSGILCFALLQDNHAHQVSSPLMPALITMFIAYLIASAFMGVYEIAVDTILQCFIEDEEHNDGSLAKPYYASGALRDFMANHRIEEPSDDVEGGEKGSAKGSSDSESGSDKEIEMQKKGSGSDSD